MPSILVVEDDAPHRRALELGLSARGFEVTAVGDGRAARDAVDSAHHDVVLLDLGLPDIDGIELCRHLHVWPGSPIVVVSGDGDDRRIVAALEVGADDYVVKPVTIDVLVARIGVQLRHAAATAALVDGQVLEAGDVTVDTAAHEVAHRRRCPSSSTPSSSRSSTILLRNAEQAGDARGAGAGQRLRRPVGSQRARVSPSAASATASATGPDRPEIVTEKPVGYRLVVPRLAPARRREPSSARWLVGLGGIALVTAICYPLGDIVDPTITALLLLVPIVAASVLGGWRRSIVVSFVAGVTYGVVFLPPFGRFRLGFTEDVFVLITFEVTAVVIGVLAGRRDRRDDHDEVHPGRLPRPAQPAEHDPRRLDRPAGRHAHRRGAPGRAARARRERERAPRPHRRQPSQVSRIRAGELVADTSPQQSGAAARRRPRSASNGRPVRRSSSTSSRAYPTSASTASSSTRSSPTSSRTPLATLLRTSRSGSPRGSGATASMIIVADRGPGFSPQARRDAFQPFRSADGSSGIGLAVCKAVVEAHGGTIALIDTGDQGAAVRLSLPFATRT